MYKICYSIGDGRDRYIWLDSGDEAECKRQIEMQEGREIIIYWISKEPERPAR